MPDKIALITGASRGLGAALVVELAPTHHIVAVARTTGALEEVDDRIKAVGGEATLAPMDITNADAMAQLCRAIHDRWGKVDVWAHTAIEAQQLMPTDHVALAEKDWAKSVAVNLDAVARLIAYVAPFWALRGPPRSFTTITRARRSSAPTVRPRPGRWRWRKLADRDRQDRAEGAHCDAPAARHRHARPFPPRREP